MKFLISVCEREKKIFKGLIYLNGMYCKFAISINGIAERTQTYRANSFHSISIGLFFRLLIIMIHKCREREKLLAMDETLNCFESAFFIFSIE